MNLVTQLLREFWFATIIAIIWTIHNISTAGTDWGLTECINIFGPTFFLTSWATGQFFRVRKQAKVESNLSSIEDRVEHLVEKQETHTEDFFGYTTGKGGMAYFMPMFQPYPILEFVLQNTSEYPVFDIHSELIDIDEKIDPKKGIFWTRHPYSVDSIYPNKMVTTGAYRFDLTQKDSLNVNVFIQTRAGGAVQEFRVRIIDKKPLIAFRTRVGDKIVEQNIPNNYPNYDPENIDDVFK